MSLTIKICKNTIILSNKAFSSLKETYLSFRDYLNLRHRCPFSSSLIFFNVQGGACQFLIDNDKVDHYI